MFDFLDKSAVWQLVNISDWISKYIVLLGLFLLSVTCLAIIIFKLREFRKQKRRMRLLLKQAQKSTKFSDLALVSKEFRDSIGGMYLIQSLEKLKFLIDTKKANISGTQAPTLSGDEVEQLQLLTQQDIDSLLMREESYLPVLGTSAAVAPLAGLFGTIWGLINAFISISQEKTADIAIIAPGIAAALLTTLAGLVVAIPAVIAFHYFSNELRKLEGQLNDLDDLFFIMVKQTFVK